MNAPSRRPGRMSGVRSGAPTAPEPTRGSTPALGSSADPRRVPADVLDGEIPSAADYGVLPPADGDAVDEVKIKERRAALARERRAGRGAEREKT